jgi:hypothetical protein
MSEFLNTINHYKIKTKGDRYTHTNLIYPCTALFVPDEELDKFQDAYTSAFKTGIDLGIVEKHKEVSPVLIDLDFKIPLLDKDENPHLSGEKYFKVEHIQSFLEKIIKILSEIVHLPKQFISYILTKPTRKDKKHPQNKYGIHIIIPDVVTLPVHQLEMREIFINQYPDFFKEFPFSNDIKDIYDEAVIQRNAWLMYGSKKNDDIVPWRVEYEMGIDISMNFKLTSKRLSIDKSGKETKYIKLFSIRNKTSSVHAITTQEKKAKARAIKSQYLPRGCRIDEDDEDDENNEIVNSPQTSDKNIEKTTISTRYDCIKSCSNISLFIENREITALQIFIHDLVNTLKASRTGSYKDWMDVCWSLKNIRGDHYESWVNFSKRSNKFDQKETDYVWNNQKVKAVHRFS